MLSRPSKLTSKQRKERRRLSDRRKEAKQRKESRRLSNRLSRREARKRARKGLALAHVLYDAALLDLLVRRNYLTDDQTTDKELVDAAITQALRDISHPSENNVSADSPLHFDRLLVG
jgi:hypothetical protein